MCSVNFENPRGPKGRNSLLHDHQEPWIHDATTGKGTGLEALSPLLVMCKGNGAVSLSKHQCLQHERL